MLTSSTRGPRILVRVSPSILAETLALALRDRELEVVLCLDGVEDAGTTLMPGDLMVTDARAGVHGSGGDGIADRVILLDAVGHASLGGDGPDEAQTVSTGTGLAQVLDLVDRLVEQQRRVPG